MGGEARHGCSDEQRAYVKPEKQRTKTTKWTILASLQGCKTYRESTEAHGWTEEFLKHLDVLPAEDHSSVATWADRARYENLRTISLNSHGSNSAPRQSRPDNAAAVAKLREVKKQAVAAGHMFDQSISDNLQVRQRQGPQFQRSEEPSADHAETKPHTKSTGGTRSVACQTRIIMGQLVVIIIRHLVARMERMTLFVN